MHMLGFIIYFVCALLLVAGYLWYGRLAEKVYGVDRGMTMPCESKADGVDFVPLPMWKIFLIQLLNIAGLGPVFGAIAGALWGPSVFLWITLGTIFAGAVHDFACGCLCRFV